MASLKVALNNMLIKSIKNPDKYRDIFAKDRVLVKNACNELLVKLKRKRIAILRTKLDMLSRIL